jgi:peptidoglycan/xylan/chitin deacetylase (PgdA/CDA1 family)
MILRGGLLAVGGAASLVAGEDIRRAMEPDRLPIDGGYAPTEDHSNLITRGQVTSTFGVATTEPLVALTFDDGPEPNWTPLVLDQLDEVSAPATFFMIGRHLRANAHLVADRMDEHEIGNHTWTHADLAEQDVNGALAELTRTADEIRTVFGRETTIMRPPWGHMAGSTVLAASKLNYDIIVWNQQLHADTYANDTAGQVAEVVARSRPGDIILGHDVGDPHRLAGLRGIGDIVRGLRAKGLEPVTVSHLLSMATAVPQV